MGDRCSPIVSLLPLVRRVGREVVLGVVVEVGLAKSVAEIVVLEYFDFR